MSLLFLLGNTSDNIRKKTHSTEYKVATKQDLQDQNIGAAKPNWPRDDGSTFHLIWCEKKKLNEFFRTCNTRALMQTKHERSLSKGCCWLDEQTNRLERQIAITYSPQR